MINSWQGVRPGILSRRQLVLTQPDSCVLMPRPLQILARRKYGTNLSCNLPFPIPEAAAWLRFVQPSYNTIPEHSCLLMPRPLQSLGDRHAVKHALSRPPVADPTQPPIDLSQHPRSDSCHHRSQLRDPICPCLIRFVPIRSEPRDPIRSTTELGFCTVTREKWGLIPKVYHEGLLNIATDSMALGLGFEVLPIAWLLARLPAIVLGIPWLTRRCRSSVRRCLEKRLHRLIHGASAEGSKPDFRRPNQVAKTW